MGSNLLRRVGRPPIPPAKFHVIVLNKKTITSLKIIDKESGEGFLRELVMIYVNQSQTMLELLREHVAQWNPEGVEKTAHKLKGSSLNLGADQLAQMLNDMETRGRENHNSDCMALLKRIEAEFTEVCEELQALPDDDG